MKNSYKNILIAALIVILVTAIIVTMVCLKNKENNNNDNITSYYKLDDRTIYLHNLDNINLNYNNDTKELKSYFEEDKNFLDKLLNILKLENTANDGGTEIYKNGEEKSFNNDDIRVIVCNTIAGNKNIHIGEKLDYSGKVCKLS